MNCLYKIGKRKCCYCKQILILNQTNFGKVYKNGGNKPEDFKYGCKKCKKGNNPLRIKFIRLKNNTCEKCHLYNIKTSFFDIDHIKPFKETKNKRKKYITRLDFPNLMLLCPNCHRLKTIRDQNY